MNISDRERQIVNDFIYMSNLKKNKTESSWILKTDLWLPEVVEGSGEGAGSGMEEWV